jgi:uncharacterized tellurite resistance protein B-like protein
LAKLEPELIKTYQNTEFHRNILLHQNEQERMNILYHLLFVINADSKINSDEERSIFKLAFSLGFSENITRDFIELMKLYPINELPNDAMLSVIRKYSN